MSRVFLEAGRDVKFFQVSDPAQINVAAERAVSLAREHGGVVVAAGGDGTINAVASATLGSNCLFGVLPQGTFNYFGRANAIPQGTEAAARALMGADVVPTQVGLVNGRAFLVNASLGLYPQVLEDREAWKQRLGRSRLVAFFAALVTLVQARRHLGLEIEMAGQSTAMQTTTLFVGNNHLQLSQVGMHEKLVEAVDEGRLAGIAVRQTKSLVLLGLMLRGLVGTMGDDDNITAFSFRRLTVNVPRKRRIRVAVDGEILWMKGPLVFEVSPTPLMLLVPAPADRAQVA